jgi:hypothetical protein
MRSPIQFSHAVFFLFLALIGLSLNLSPHAFAHPPHLAYLDIRETDGTWRASLEGHPGTIRSWLDGAATEKLYEDLFRESSWKLAPGPILVEELDENSIRLSADLEPRADARNTSAGRARFISIGTWPRQQGFQIFLAVDPNGGGASGETSVLSPARPRWSQEERRSLATDVFLSGIRHIGALPEGLDHVLFTFILALAAWPPLRALGAVTGFTAGHSLTLALAQWNLVPNPSAVVEPMIALTIAISALMVWLAARRNALAGAVSWRLTAFFGLIHGLGFASGLAELPLAHDRKWLALGLFNLGIEAGQIAVIAAVFVGIAAVNRVTSGPAWRQWPAFAVLALAAFWFFERIAFAG